MESPQLFYGALQLADIIFQLCGNVFRNGVGKLEAKRFRFFNDDGGTGLKIGNADIRDKSRFKAGL